MLRPRCFSTRNFLAFSIRKWSSESSCQPSKDDQWVKPKGHDTGVKVYNCVARAKVPLIVRNRHLATFYTCGPTVYDATHLGHASCYVKLDIVQRLLQTYFGIPLVTAMNITDIDDKIIRRGQETGRDWQEIARENEQSFWQSLKRLGVQLPDYKVRVTEHLPEIQSCIQKLLKSGHAYRASDSSVYFDCATLAGHGKLSKLPQPAESAEAQSLIKRSGRDFALWKAVNSGPAYEAEFGPGRPGWHIECSAMASKVFGDCIDFHGGGWDLLFPHHENEESQSCALHQKSQWVNYWLHTGQLRLEGATEKMSKSVGNTISVDDFLEVHSADDFRMFCLLSNYRSNTEFSEEAIRAAHRVLMKLRTFLSDMQLHRDGQQMLRMSDSQELHQRLIGTTNAYDAALRDDFDTARGIKALLELVGFVNRNQHDNEAAQLDAGLLNCTSRFFKMQLQNLGLKFPQDHLEKSQVSIGPVVESALTIRSELRRRAKSSNDKSLFSLADHIRRQLAEAGIEIKDRDKQKSTWSMRGME